MGVDEKEDHEKAAGAYLLAEHLILVRMYLTQKPKR